MLVGMRTLILLLMSVTLLSACGGKNKELPVVELDSRPVEAIYNEAANLLDAGEFSKASAMFNEVERQHPYSQWATRAQLMAAYGYFKAQNFDEAILALDRFIRLHPGNRDIDYAYYLMALSHYNQISDVRRDQAMTNNALQSFDALLTRFPDSKYARDASLKRDLTLDHLAGKEMDIGRYYLKQGHYNAAIPRFMEVVKAYDTTTHAPEALHRLVESYMGLGLKSEATRVAAVLGYNYPGSVWYEDSFALLDPEARAQLKANQPGFFKRAYESMFGR